VKIIRKNFYPSLPNLATLRLSGSISGSECSQLTGYSGVTARGRRCRRRNAKKSPRLSFNRFLGPMRI